MSAFYNRNPAIFKDHYDAVYLHLIIYIWHEQLKGDKSFWEPYFETINTCDMPFMWTSEEIDEFQDNLLK